MPLQLSPNRLSSRNTNDRPHHHVWQAYQQLEQVNGSPQNELIALVSLLRKVCGLDETLTTFEKTVDRNFQNWVFGKQAGPVKFNEEQMQWLRMIKDHVSNSFHISRDDFASDLSELTNHRDVVLCL